ncbi:MAG: DUF2924 domain-containing protein [Planctomycetota bacterium]|nr:DUF2924 domain-containing protein [Planctomycetota bacterium]
MPTRMMAATTQARRAAADVTRQLAELRDMTVGQLRDKYREVFGEPSRSRNKVYLRKKVAWRIQELAEGGLSDRARSLLEELAEGAPVRWRGGSRRREAAASPLPDANPERDPRLPPPGTLLTRCYRGDECRVTVLKDGFKYRGERYRSLSKIAREITGTNWNGFLFFHLQRRTRMPEGSQPRC